MKLFFTFLLLVTCAYGRLGEDRDQLVVRLGPVKLESKHFVVAQGKITPLGPALFFEKDQWQIQCDLVDGHCARITYTKKGDWTSQQIATLLENNAQGQRWTEAQDSTKMIRKWKRQDGGTAIWQFTGLMQLVSSAYLQAAAHLEAGLQSNAERKPDL